MTNPAYGHIINEKHFDRIIPLIHPDKIVFDGIFDKQSCKISPTTHDSITFDDTIMNEDLFGSILPILSINSADQTISIINHHDKNRQFSLFLPRTKNVSDLLTEKCAFGDGWINDTVIHITSNNMGFAGTDESGIELYHGKT